LNLIIRITTSSDSLYTFVVLQSNERVLCVREPIGQNSEVLVIPGLPKIEIGKPMNVFVNAARTITSTRVRGTEVVSF
jgi:hypothetical protein